MKAFKENKSITLDASRVEFWLRELSPSASRLNSTARAVICDMATAIAESSTVALADIREAVVIEPDYFSEPPWVDCDGYEHEMRSLTS